MEKEKKGLSKGAKIIITLIPIIIGLAVMIFGIVKIAGSSQNKRLENCISCYYETSWDEDPEITFYNNSSEAIDEFKVKIEYKILGDSKVLSTIKDISPITGKREYEASYRLSLLHEVQIQKVEISSNGKKWFVPKSMNTFNVTTFVDNNISNMSYILLIPVGFFVIIMGAIISLSLLWGKSAFKIMNKSSQMLMGNTEEGLNKNSENNKVFIQCPYCGESYSDDKTRCPSCGARRPKNK